MEVRLQTRKPRVHTANISSVLGGSVLHAGFRFLQSSSCLGTSDDTVRSNHLVNVSTRIPTAEDDTILSGLEQRGDGIWSHYNAPLLVSLKFSGLLPRGGYLWYSTAIPCS